ncbi:MAG: NmrA/HSCARG family protein [Planctomycetes bacterium]|nr:NmrA/HSCARG family protein [Planctomycetota bacterium]MCB9901787.1 NmrA/HSCARG family protein [Planctomycetota bacterium]
MLAVIGATGAQGGGLVRAALADREGPFAVRAITRNPDGDKGRALAAQGAEVVAADLDDQASLERAFAGAHGAFCVTNFWEHFSPEKELAQATALADAAKAAGVKHVVWSTLEDTRKHVPLSDDRMPTLMGSYKVPHFDAKGEADAVFAARVPTTNLATSFYWDNLIHFGMGPQPLGDGRYAFRLPMGDAKLPGMAAEDIGACAYGIFRAGDETVGKTIAVAGEQLTGHEMAAKLGHALGKEVVYEAVPFDVYRGLGFPGADDLGNMFQFKHDFPEAFCGPRDPAVARRFNPSLQDFDTWLAANASKIPLPA